MNRFIAIFLITVITAAFLSACTPEKQTSSQTPTKAPDTVITASVIKSDTNAPPPQKPQTIAQTKKSDPNTIQTKPIEPNTVNPKVTEPNAVKPPVVEPNTVKPNVSEPNTVKPQVKIPQVNEPNTAFYEKYAVLLKTYVNDKGLVNYNLLKRHKPELRSLLDDLAKTEPNEYAKWSKEQKTAFWINAYNIKLLSIITDNYPIQTTRIRLMFWPPTDIRHIDGEGTWKTYKFIVMNEEFTLPTVEYRFFRKEFSDPRVFFAIAQATLDGPPLRTSPYTGAKLDDQLNEQILKFLAEPRAFRIDRENKVVYLSALFEPSSYGSQFISKYGTDKKFKDKEPAIRAVLNFLINYLDQGQISFLEVENYTVSFVKYDWRLNQ